MWAGVFLLLIMYVFSLALTQGGTRLRLPGRLVPVLAGIVNYPWKTGTFLVGGFMPFVFHTS